jgi:hypothetical protein
MFKNLIVRLRAASDWASANEIDVPVGLADDLDAAADALSSLSESAAVTMQLTAQAAQLGKVTARILSNEARRKGEASRRNRQNGLKRIK